MTDLALLMAERACERLMIEYCECVDTRDFKKLISLFSRDGVLRRPDGEFKGQAAIAAFFDKLTTDPLIHVCSNMLINIDGPQSGEATSYVTVFRSYGKNADGLPKLEDPYVVAKYVDQFKVEDGQWKIAYRDTIFAAKI
ncbi:MULTISPECIES: nuclear transport factor 2 family protein [unclassified Chelatococcus]|uniref:nuclear transport factor 2 family protein n=1 Tax=unclassified Chelatococcus TaxID=2638111 RepID=UPI001BD0BD5B|nr:MULTISPECIES: nuclear transport factor 2 family protein [unclassified Chelatococcus]MBS7743731.1 nuclear transport factor 2 family protein [Chelatococcus sp. HY11]MBX3547267.1 nuclear transport factor 2 family protein [Chelatococcus sp.]CAH1664718.1 SnoaL-like protein [Hyphomicrobiales bacterium]CAH1688451.1 SnoaL-like protein [Hyphomicrobiales bacterium]